MAICAISLSGCINTRANDPQVTLQEITSKSQAEDAGLIRSSISNSSMEPTLNSGGIVYGIDTGAQQNRSGSFEGGSYTIQTGDVVAFSEPIVSSRENIKRCIATSGQTVDINNSGDLIVDGEVLSEPYIEGKTYTLKHTANNMEISYPYRVPDGKIFVLGDNREYSSDSRYYGAIDTSSVYMVALKVVNPYTDELENI